MWPKQIVIVRHAESEGNAKKADDNSMTEVANHQFSLTVAGQEQALTTGEHLRVNYEFDAFFVSTFERTQQSFALMFPEVKPIVDSRLDEFWRGIWHTMSEEEAVQAYPQEVRIKEREGLYHYRAPGGQNGQDVDLMIYSFLSDLRELYANKRLLIVGHGTWMIFFWRIMRGLSIKEAEARYKSNKYHNASVTVFDQKDESMVLTLDDYVPPKTQKKSNMSDWYEPWVTKKKVEKIAEDLRAFMETPRWYKLLARLSKNNDQLTVYTYDDACDMHDAIYLTGQGFIGPYRQPVENLVEVVEGFMTHRFYGAESDAWNRSQNQHPRRLLPWLRSECSARGL